MCEYLEETFVVPNELPAMGWWLGQVLSESEFSCLVSIVWTQLPEYKGPMAVSLMKESVTSFNNPKAAMKHLRKERAVWQQQP